VSAGVRDRVNPYRLYMVSEFASATFVALAYTTSILYWVESGHLNPLQLILLGTVVELSYFLLQLPTGILADLVSRRLCVVIGWILVGAGIAMQGLSPSFTNLMIAQVLVGCGAAMQEGATDAWIAGELRDDAMTSVYIRAAQLAIAGSIIGAVLSGIIANHRQALPMIIGGGGICAFGVLLAFVMPEKHFPHRASAEALTGVGRRAWTAFAEQLRSARVAMIAVPGLVLLFAMTFFVGAWSESFDRLWGDFLITELRFPHLLGLRTATWFSVIACAVALLSLGSTEIAKRRTDRLGHASVVSTLLAVTALIGIGALVMASAHVFVVAIVAYLLVQVLRPVFYPLISGWIVGRVDPRVRATVLSARDMSDAGGQILGGPVVGWIGVAGSIRVALYAGSAALVPAVALLLAATRRVRVLPPEVAVEEDAVEPVRPVSDVVS
jgi:DHA3 family tetracycline resistance protein-like MFS transporter